MCKQAMVGILMDPDKSCPSQDSNQGQLNGRSRRKQLAAQRHHKIAVEYGKPSSFYGTSHRLFLNVVGTAVNTSKEATAAIKSKNKEIKQDTCRLVRNSNDNNSNNNHKNFLMRKRFHA